MKVFFGGRKARLVWAAGVSAVLVLVFAGFLGGSDDELFLKIYRGIDIFGKVYKEVASNYVDEIDPDKFMRAGIDGMLKTLDPYTVYIDEREHDEIDLVTTGKYGGVGITVGVRDGAVTVVGLLEGFSAAKHGIQIGDRIVEIDGTSLDGKSFDTVRMLVRGAPGTEIKMKIERDGEPVRLEFVLLREEIPVQNVSYAGIVGNGIGYIHLERFSRTSGDDVRLAIKEISGKGTMRGLVLDLRDNPGGLLDMAVEVASKFLPESSLVVSTRGRRSDAERKYFTTGTPMLPEIPLAVLVDGGSASASEIVAGAIQDLDRGVIVGTRTFGKGLVQTISRLSESTSLKITTGRYFTPSGRSIQEIDYLHRDEDGGVRIMPDSLRREFRTLHNRSVFEAGGIMPDSVIRRPDYSPLAQALFDRAMFFKFAHRFARTRGTLPEGFKITPTILKDFKAFVNEQGFVFKESTTERLAELRTYAERANFGPGVFAEIDKLETLINQERERAFERHEDELRGILALEIIGRIKGEKARIAVSLEDDHQLDAALALLEKRKLYDTLLTGKTK
ncbi:MAG TPA: S41 family peptidase [Bacteroidota bacterium]